MRFVFLGREGRVGIRGEYGFYFSRFFNIFRYSVGTGDFFLFYKKGN